MASTLIAAIFKLSAIALFRLVSIATIGVLLSLKHFLKKPGIRGLSEIICKVLLPCLLFTILLKHFHIMDFHIWMSIFAVVALSRIIGLGFGFVLGTGLELSTQNIKLTMATFAFTHSNCFQFLFIESLTQVLAIVPPRVKEFKELNLDPQARGTSYEMLTAAFSAFFVWSIGYALLRKDKRPREDLPQEVEENIVGRESPEREAEQPPPLIYQPPATNAPEEPPHVLQERVSPQELSPPTTRRSSPDRASPERSLANIIYGSMNATRSFSFSFYQNERNRLGLFLFQMKMMSNIPVYAFLISLILAALPFVQYWFTAKGLLFNITFYGAADIVGQCLPAIMVLTAGAGIGQSFISNFSEDQQEKIPNHALYIIAIFKLLIFPWVGMFIVFGSYIMNWIQDPILVFILLLQFTNPHAISLKIIANIHHNQEGNLSKSLIIQYIMGFFTITIFITLYLYILDGHLI